MQVLIIDYQSSKAPELLDQSLRDTGFAVIKNHPIPQSLLTDFYSEWERFFNSPAKFDYRFDPNIQHGYFPFRTENAKDSPVKDLKEFFHLFPSTPFPQGIGTPTREVKKHLETLATELLTWLESKLPSSIRSRLSTPLSEMIQDSSSTLLRVLHYPPLPETFERGAIRAAAHEDINLITLLPAATEPGLQVRSLDGQWHDVPCNPGFIAINSGDMLQMATDGYYPSTTHQVINPEGESAHLARYSSPLFLHPRSEVLLQPNMTAGQYLDQRLKEIGLKLESTHPK